MRGTRKMKNQSVKGKQITIILSAVFLVLILLFSIKMLPHLKDKLESAKSEKAPLAQITEELENDYAENFCYKNQFININGLMARVLGQKSLNNMIRQDNGYLTGIYNVPNASERAKSFIALSNFLKNKDINFLHVIAPSTDAFYGAQLPTGYETTARDALKTYVSILKQADVPVIDVDAYFEKHGYEIEDVYFKTDHHWLPQAAFDIYIEMMEYMCDNFGITVDETMLDIGQYECET